MENILRFENPEWLYALLVIPVMIAIYVIVRIRQEKKFRQFASDEMFGTLAPRISSRRSNLKFVCLLAAVAFLALALANLQSGSKMEEVKREGIDLFIAVDVSNSMNAQDIVPCRLDRAKQSISRLISDLRGDRLGIIVFADKAFVQLPVTTDYAAAKMFLSTVNTNSVASQGTAIGEAINVAMKSFAEDERSKAVIIISDGEDHEDDAAVKAASEAVKKGIRIYTIGMGLAEGAPIPEYDRYGHLIGYRKDRNGATIVTRLDETMLQSIANAGGGIYVRASNSNVGLEKIYKDISDMEKSEIETKVFTDYEDQFQWFLLPALVLLLMSIIISPSKTKLDSHINIFETNEDEKNK